MASLIRTRDWTQFPLGHLQQWPDTLVTTLNTMLSSHFAGITFWGPNLLQFYNDRAIPLLTERHPRDLGVPARESWKHSWQLLEPRLRSVFETGESFSEQDGLVPVVRNGVMQDVYWTYSYSPIYEPTGKISGISVVFQDNTGRNLAERQRDALSQQLHEVFNATTDAIVHVNRDWVMTFVNRKARELYTQTTDLIGRRVWDAFPDAVYDGSPFVEHYYRAMNQRIAGEFEAYYPAPIDAWLQIMVYPTHEGIVTISRDITTRKKSEAALIQSEKLAVVGRLASSIAHEINNPLESVMNVIYLARHSTNLEEIDQYLETSERELKRVAEITNQTLKFHKQTTSPTALSSRDLFASVRSVHHTRANALGITLDFRDRSTTPIRCFEGEIRQVVSNLIGNALDASRGGRIFLRSHNATHWRTGESGIVFTIADTGSGMPPHVLAKAFEPFFTTKGLSGTGLGLWVSHEIVTRHRGSLTVRSASSGHATGTVFRLFLPHNAVAR